MSEFNKLWEQLNSINEVAKAKASQKELKETYIARSFDFESEVDYYGAIYCARELVYSLVKDPKSAAKLYREFADDSIATEELDMICDLIGDALEGANYYDDADDYMRNNPIPYWKSERATDAEKTTIDGVIATCKTRAQKTQLLMDAVQATIWAY